LKPKPAQARAHPSPAQVGLWEQNRGMQALPHPLVTHAAVARRIVPPCCAPRPIQPWPRGAAPSRRALACTALGALLAGALPARVQAADGFTLDPVAPGAFAHFGQIALATPADRGDIANLGVVVGREAVAVIDTGGSVAVGRALRHAIAALTGLPVRYVINTHVHPDHLFGNAAFADTGAVFVGHHRLVPALAARGAYYLQSYRDQIGADAIAEVRLIAPTRTVDGETTLDLGGRALRLIAAAPAAHSDCDLVVLDAASGTLFTGDLLFVRHVPVLDGSLPGWLSLLPVLAALPAVQAVPGHGPRAVPWPAALEDERRYLTTLAADTRRLIAAGVPLAAAVPRIEQSERGRWALFDAYTPRNATAAYGELEWE
jgi:quinoprotein relay system zinc metallohydrolase 2